MPHEPNDLAPELKSLEAALAGLSPSAQAIDRDGLLYAAGESAARGAARRRFVRCVVPALAVGWIVLPLVFGQLWITERQQLLAERSEHAADMQAALLAKNGPPATPLVPSEERSEAPALTMEKQSYLRLRQVVLEDGPDALESPPAPDGAASPAAPPLRSRDSWLQGT